MDFDEVYFTAITPSATEPIRLSVRQKRRNKKKTSMASRKSEKNTQSRDSSVGALSLKQESPGGDESEPVQASVSGDDNNMSEPGKGYDLAPDGREQGIHRGLSVKTQRLML
ncbi:hypothetical protein DER46DRAFT_579117 [Fusarium sp. MPI-SDFR-AT-0072]|nr:hypothetical protein DER46DRAFT_579117 [Fusarium sp. MPI-SDFR-AT-0072]